MKNSMVMFMFFCFWLGVSFFWKFFPKIKLACWSWNLEPRLIRIGRIKWWFSFFFRLEIPFLVNLVQKLKRVKFYGDVHFFYFRPFFKFCQKNQFSILMIPDYSPNSLLAETLCQWLFSSNITNLDPLSWILTLCSS